MKPGSPWGRNPYSLQRERGEKSLPTNPKPVPQTPGSHPWLWGYSWDSQCSHEGNGRGVTDSWENAGCENEETGSQEVNQEAGQAAPWLTSFCTLGLVL